MDDGKDKKGKKKVGQKADQDDSEADSATLVLRSLCNNGPLTIAELVNDTKLALSDLLDTLITVREFELISFVGEDARVQITAAGSKTVTAAAKNDIREEAAKMLEE